MLQFCRPGSSHVLLDLESNAQVSQTSVSSAEFSIQKKLTVEGTQYTITAFQLLCYSNS
jgi:hypothetical protein